MKVIFLVGYMLLTVFSSFALATGSSRWRMLADGSIEWVPAKQIPHSDHIEMSGKQVSVVLESDLMSDAGLSRKHVTEFLRVFVGSVDQFRRFVADRSQ